MSDKVIPPKPKDKRTKRYKEWVAKYENASTGLGDSIEKITEATGIKKAVKFIAGEDCGCSERKSTLNAMFPYNKPNCFTEEEFDFLNEFFGTKAWDRRKQTGETLKKIYSVYNRVFNVNDSISGCNSCVMDRVKRLNKLYKEYL